MMIFDVNNSLGTHAMILAVIVSVRLPVAQVGGLYQIV
jgi:hypothetical protein